MLVQTGIWEVSDHSESPDARRMVISGPTCTMGRLEVQTGSAMRSKESSTKGEALQFCPPRQEKSAALLLHYRLQMRGSGCN